MKTPIKQGGVHMHYNDGAIHVDGSICGTAFRVEKTPHWQRFGDGSAALELTGAMFGKGIVEVQDKCWLQLDTSETGEKSSRRTMICLNGKADIERLRDMCNMVLGNSDEIEAQMRLCWMDIARLRGIESADREMLLNMNWKAPGSAS